MYICICAVHTCICAHACKHVCVGVKETMLVMLMLGSKSIFLVWEEIKIWSQRNFLAVCATEFDF